MFPPRPVTEVNKKTNVTLYRKGKHVIGAKEKRWGVEDKSYLRASEGL